MLDAVLIADDGSVVHRHDPLPDVRAGEIDVFWRAGYEIAIDLLEDRRVAFAIETGEGILLDLPHPEEHHRTTVLHAAPGFTTRKARRHLALVAGMLAAASVPMGIPAIAVTQDDTPPPAQQDLAAASAAQATTETTTVDATPPPGDPAAAAQQAQAASDATTMQVPATPAPAPTPSAGSSTSQAMGAKGDKSPGPTPPTDSTMNVPGAAAATEPKPHKRKKQRRSGSKHGAKRDDTKNPGTGTRSGATSNHTGNSAPIRTPGGAPTRSNPSFFDALPGPADVQGVPNFVIRKFRVPVFLLPIYQAAGIQYGIRWEVLAAINEIETDYGRNLNISSAGALGWMQFMPATWKQYGVDANKDGQRDPFNPVDAIFASARYLKAAGGDKDIRRAVFAYNHADWYVDSVLLRTKLIAGIPGDLVGSLTGLTEGRFPVAARARYADDIQEKNALKLTKKGQNAANVVASNDSRRGVDIFAKQDSPVVAVNDGEIKKVGKDRRGKLAIVLQDVYGNRYTYRDLGSIAKWYPVPKADSRGASKRSDAGAATPKDPKPTTAASAGSQDAGVAPAKKRAAARTGAKTTSAAPATKQRLFAHPARPKSRTAGGEQQLWSTGGNAQDWQTYKTYGATTIGLNAKNADLKRLKKGSRVVTGTVLGRVGKPAKSTATHVRFEIRPAGRGAPSIDPKPILDGWKLLESTAIYRAKGRNVLYGDNNDGFSIGQLMLLSKEMLQKRVLSDDRIQIYPGGSNDIKTGQIDRRVLATLEYLAEIGLKPTVSSLKGNHGYLTASGNVSEHSSGTAVDISAINGIPILGHQEKGGITEQAVRRLMMLQGTMAPHQIISLIDLGANTLAMSDHGDHIHVGFRPLFGENKKLGQQASAVLKPGQWNDLIDRLRQIDNPVVPTKPSKYSIRTRGSSAHKGE